MKNNNVYSNKAASNCLIIMLIFVLCWIIILSGYLLGQLAWQGPATYLGISFVALFASSAIVESEK
jgi:uncharacterized membrane protein